MAQKGAVGRIRAQAHLGGSVSRADDMYAVLVGLGYSGSLMDMRRKDYLQKLALVEPQFKSDADLELAYLRGLGFTGSIADMRIASGRPNFP